MKILGTVLMSAALGCIGGVVTHLNGADFQGSLLAGIIIAGLWTIGQELRDLP